MVGNVVSWEQKPGEKLFTVTVKLSTDFKKLSHVYIVNSMFKEEQEELEKKSEADSKEN
jgi:cell shape-determining protein MreC